MELLDKNQKFLKELLKVYDKTDKTSRSYIIREFNNSNSPTKVRDISRTLNAPISVILAILEETKTATCITYKRNNPTKAAEDDYTRAKSILRELKNRERKEKEATQKKRTKKSSKKTESTSSRKGESMGTDIDEITDRVGDFVAKYLGGDDEKFTTMFDDFIHGRRVLDSMQCEINCYGREIEERFKDCIELIDYLDPVKHQEYEELYKRLQKPLSEVAICNVGEEYRKVQEGEETVYDAMDHLHCTLHAYEVAVDGYEARIKNGGNVNKMSKRYSKEYNASIAPKLFERYINDEKIADISADYGRSATWASQVIANYVNSSDDPEIKLQYEAQKAKNIAERVKKDIVDDNDEEMDDCVVETKDIDLEEETVEEPHKMPFMNESKSEVKEEVTEEVKEEASDTSDLDGKVFRLFEANDVIEVDLYKGQKNTVSDNYIFENKVEAINNLTISKQDVRDFISKNVKFTHNGNPKSDIIVYISSIEDYGLGYPVVDVCNEMGIVLSICVFNKDRRRFDHYYATGGNSNASSDKGMYYSMFPDVNRVEGLGCDIEHILDAKYLYQMKEIVNKDDSSKFVYKLLCMELEPLKEYYASLIGHVVLDKEDHISLSLQKCRVSDNGKLVEIGEEIMPFKNYN